MTFLNVLYVLYGSLYYSLNEVKHIYVIEV